MYHRDDKRELKIDVYKSGLQITYSQPTDTVTDVSPRSVSRVRQGRHHNELSACKEIRYRCRSPLPLPLAPPSVLPLQSSQLPLRCRSRCVAVAVAIVSVAA